MTLRLPRCLHTERHVLAASITSPAWHRWNIDQGVTADCYWWPQHAAIHRACDQIGGLHGPGRRLGAIHILAHDDYDPARPLYDELWPLERLARLYCVGRNPAHIARLRQLHDDRREAIAISERLHQIAGAA